MNSNSTPLTPKLDVTLSLTLSPSPTAPPHDQNHHSLILPEQRGIRLIQLLVRCAKHAASGNLHRADACLSKISELASVSGDSMQRLAARFASSLAIRLVKRWPGLHKALNFTHKSKPDMDQPQLHFSETFPCLRLAYAIITRNFLHAMTQERVIHIVDLGSGDCQLWFPILQGLARFPYGPPHLRLSCVSSNNAVLERFGRRLTKEAQSFDLPFQFNPINVSLRDLTLNMLEVRPQEALAFISILNLHVLLAQDDRVDAQFGGNKNNNNNSTVKDCKKMSEFLAMIQSVGPKLLFLVEQEVDHNFNGLVDRFVHGLHYYSAVFDSIDANSRDMTGDDRVILEEMFGREIENIVACEGMERFERHERHDRWAVRFGQVGFRPCRLWYQGEDDDEEDRKQVDIDAFSHRGYKVTGRRTCLMICWQDRPLYSVTAWTC